MIRLCSVWERQKESGEIYYKGRLGDIDVLLFSVTSEHVDAPAFDIMLSERRRKRAEGD